MKKTTSIALGIVFIGMLLALASFRPYVKHIVALDKHRNFADHYSLNLFHYKGKSYFVDEAFVYRCNILSERWRPHSEGFLVYDFLNTGFSKDEDGLKLLDFDQDDHTLHSHFGTSEIVYKSKDTLIGKRGDTLDIFVFRDRD